VIFQASGYPIPDGEASLAAGFSVENKPIDINGLYGAAESFRKARRNTALIAGRSGGAARAVPYCRP
jgi:hypothetical protein